MEAQPSTVLLVNKAKQMTYIKYKNPIEETKSPKVDASFSGQVEKEVIPFNPIYAIESEKSSIRVIKTSNLEGKYLHLKSAHARVPIYR